MVTVYNAYKEQAEQFCENREAALKWIKAQAVELNYGLYRSWSMDNKDFYDVGPHVYFIYKDNK